MSISEIDSRFGERVRAARVTRGQKQDELAAAVTRLNVEMTTATIGKIERGERRVTIGEASALARALVTTIEELTRGDKLDRYLAFVESLQSGLVNASLDTLRGMEDYVEALEASGDLSVSTWPDLNDAERELAVQAAEHMAMYRFSPYTVARWAAGEAMDEVPSDHRKDLSLDDLDRLKSIEQGEKPKPRPSAPIVNGEHSNNG